MGRASGRARLAGFTLEDHAYGASRLPKTSKNDCFCGRARLARFTLEDHAYGASRLPKTSKNDCFAVYYKGEHLSYVGDQWQLFT